MLKTTKQVALFFLVLVYLFFEEIVWEKIAIPIYNYIRDLRIHTLFLGYITSYANRYVVLLLFITPFLLGEILGILSGVLATQMHIISAIILYTLKIPLVLVALSILEAGKEKLNSFEWFAKTYNTTINILSRLKSSSFYQSIKNKIVFAKEKTKVAIKKILSAFRRYKL